MKKLVIYLTFMYPNENQFYAILDMLEGQKVDVVELGVPVCNPYMDGEIIQKSHQQVLNSGITSRHFREHLEKIRSRYSFEITLMTYQSGIDEFGLLAIPDNLYDGILCVDAFIKNDAVDRLVQLFNEDMSLVECQQKLANSNQFHYVMSGVGKTGTFASVPTGYQVTIPFLRQQSSLDIYVGFGIKTPAEVAEVCKNGADGVIIGSYFMQLLETEGLIATSEYLEELQAVL